MSSKISPCIIHCTIPSKIIRCIIPFSSRMISSKISISSCTISPKTGTTKIVPSKVLLVWADFHLTYRDVSIIFCGCGTRAVMVGRDGERMRSGVCGVTLIFPVILTSKVCRESSIFSSRDNRITFLVVCFYIFFIPFLLVGCLFDVSFLLSSDLGLIALPRGRIVSLITCSVTKSSSTISPSSFLSLSQQPPILF
ncbi:unnamed protein product [Moneuplotes crassus]|uniref:Uncharacterized protein n=1 Tax=Euplotes crassus TaxID=5936 RepID=A0AAD1XRN3_EUPCR|nr:unnamed protein product [Moneuplotes crassus]